MKYADVVVCDSREIEKYIQKEYGRYSSQTCFIPYGADPSPATLKDSAPKYARWLSAHQLTGRRFVICVGRFVPENNFDIMIREFIQSRLDMDFVLISTENARYAAKLQKKYHYLADCRIKFVGSVYDTDLLAKIREKAAAYIHGHEVGGTNPSLLESMGKTHVNLLLDVPFNREVGGDAALYWTKEEGSLATLLNSLADVDAEEFGRKAKERMKTAYSWESVANDYEDVFRIKTK